ncbi:uncharacterized protein LOC113215492 [Frankliniella occidentalis]|uniref:Uncharacterized protein LOC113215492 n=1 Tax=Frankliniella occidentalis TaxID=133901 RepID=A0A6J1TJA2_FRAOC|nr:uncharacterized protein LOC113215492 [Frankliniella occidentalis]
MGNSLEAWRAAIGSFCPAACAGPKKNQLQDFIGIDFNCKYYRLFWFLVLTSLLIIANVESNPGPAYQCQKCSETFETLRGNAEHQQSVHSLERKFVYSCAWPSCGHLIFCTFKALSVHLCKFHDKDTRSNVGTERLQCSSPGCTQEASSMTNLCHHLINDHGVKSNETIRCPFPSCKRGPYKISTFRVHLSDYHDGWLHNKSSTISETSIENAGLFDFDLNTSMNDDDPPTTENQFEEHHENNEIHEETRFYQQVARFYLMMEAEFMLPTSTVQAISVALANLFRVNIGFIKKAAIRELEGIQLSPTEKENMLSALLLSDKLFCCHSKEINGASFITDATRKTFYKRNFTYIEPQEINLSKDPTSRKCIHVVSIKETREVLLPCPSIKKQVEESFRSQEQGPRSDNCFSDYRDGSVYKNSNSSKKRTIDLNIFMDSFNPLKDLGAAADNYDTLGMYMTIGNLKPHIRSKLQSMHLVMLIPKFKDMYKQFKDKCFKHVISELKLLEENGINFNGEIIPVVLQFLIGDSKGQNQIGGFVESFTALHYCRFCPMSRDDFRATPWGRSEQLRTKESYREDVREFKRLKLDDNAISHYNGVKSSSPFNELNDFHVTDPRLCPCIAHDIFEAIGDRYDMSEIINHLVENSWFSLATLNSLIRKFKYSSSDLKNKPGKVQENKMGGHAIQNWTLLRLLPIIIGESRILDPSDAYWQLYLKLKNITEYVCAPSITIDQVDLLKLLIEEYLFDRQNLLDRLPQPKHHFLNHYSELIELMGPLIHLFTMRFESVHKFFKQCARNAKNTINIGMTMSKKSALYFCYLSTGFWNPEGIATVGEEVLDIYSDTHDQDTRAEMRRQSFSVNAHEAKCVAIGDNEIKKEDWLLLKCTSVNTIIVGFVQCIVINEGVVTFVMKQFTSSLWADYGLYKIDQNSELGILSTPYTDLSYPRAQSVYSFGGHQCFSLKHQLVCSAYED